jgi:signal transduction histidine kinase
VLFSSLFVITIAAIVTLSLVIAHQEFSTSVDDQIKGSASTVSDRIRSGEDPLATLNTLATPSQWLEIVDLQGEITYRSSNLSSRTLPTYVNPGEILPHDGLHTLNRRGSVIRVIRHALTDSNGHVTGYLVVGGLVSGTGDSTLDLGMILIPAAVAGLFAVVGGTIWFARRESEPLKQLADEVQATAASGFRRAVAGTGRGSQETRDLRRAVSVLIDRQRAVIDRERAFFADSSHVLRTPLAVLKGDVELLEQGVTGAERDEAVAQANNAIDAMSRTISGLLLLASEPAESDVSWEVVDLGTLLAGLVQDAALTHPRLTVRAEPAVSRLEVAGDPHQLKDLFVSLLENACRYTPDGGSVIVAGCIDGDQLEIAIRDTGIGFSPEDLKRASERFYRGAAARRRFPAGSGLGLSIADRIVKLHHGELRLEANSPRGAAAIVRLPTLD